MILYNITAIVDNSIQMEWNRWNQEVHIEEVMASGCFVSSRMLKVVDSPNEGVTFCSQFIAESMEKYDQYQREFASQIAAAIPAEFQNKFVTFPTLMEFIDSK